MNREQPPIVSVDLAAMKVIAQPLDRWCDLCEVKLATNVSADDVAACDECAQQVLAAMKQYGDEEKELGVWIDGFVKGPFFDNRAMRRDAKRWMRRRNDGMLHGAIRTGTRCR